MVFFDNASTTRMCENALEAINKYSCEDYYNPSALYANSLEVLNNINTVRDNIIKALGGMQGDRFIFTSGATEANNTVIRSCARNKKDKLLFSMAEHPSVYNVAQELKSLGYNVDFVNITRQGTIDTKDLLNKLDENTALVSFMHVNNETGAINDVKSIVKLIKSHSNAKIHVDGVQAFLKINVNVTSLGVDFYTISSHKFHGPKGIGGFFVKSGVNIKPFIIGGGQEFGLRSGTENVPAIMGMYSAICANISNINNNHEHVQELSDYLKKEVNKFGYALNLDSQSPYINVLSFNGVRAETILHILETKGFLVGNGSACSSKHRDNRVLSAVGLDKSEVEGSIRVSFSELNTLEEVKSFVVTLNNCIEEYKQNTKGK